MLASCGKDSGNDQSQDQTAKQYLLPLATTPQLDLVFMIDNSPSMAPKQEKLKAQFPRLIEALRSPGDGSLPDLRVAIIDSDLGTGGAYLFGSCGQNDSNNNSLYGDKGSFMMPNALGCGVTDGNAQWLEYQSGAGVNFKGDVSSVFACLASSLGTVGCGFEQQLEAYEYAFAEPFNLQQRALLRSGAHLGLVFLSDEDDCSASGDDGLYGDKSETRGESASLRCATRAHACGGKNLSTFGAGYPTKASFEAPFDKCVARTDTCPNSFDHTGATDTSVPTSCNPLRNVKKLASNLKSLKEHPGEQLLVSGIFGWPLDDAAPGSYTIAPVPNPNSADTEHPTVFDLWPVCYDPNHPPVNPDPVTGFDAEAAGYGAAPGLRMGAFIDEFAANGSKFSICQPDYSAAMSQIGAAIAKKMRNQCVPTSFTWASQCSATYESPDGSRQPIPMCDASESVVPCYTLVSDPELCPGDNYLVHLNRGLAAADPVPAGTWLIFGCS
jgi:hypothetical protein